MQKLIQFLDILSDFIFKKLSRRNILYITDYIERQTRPIFHAQCPHIIEVLKTYLFYNFDKRMGFLIKGLAIQISPVCQDTD